MSRKSAVKFTKHLRVCNDGAPSMICGTARTVALLEEIVLFLNINATVSVLKTLDLEHVMISVVKCVNNIGAR